MLLYKIGGVLGLVLLFWLGAGGGLNAASCVMFLFLLIKFNFVCV